MDIEEWKRQKMRELLERRRKAMLPTVEVLTSPTCPYCPMAVRLAKEMEAKGLCNAREISVATPEGMDLARKHSIQGVPTILINGRVAFVGVPARHEFEQALRALANVQ